ncbi:MAG: hypothetical protein M0P31_00740 [Solirubrobacteraceae bacterium]|nr:hypothetical protein [Solirubrobacteraceae bacterium]
MSIRLKATALLATGAIAGGAATAIANAGPTTDRRAPSGASATGHGGADGPRHGPLRTFRDRGGAPSSGLADRLGITQERLDAAFDAARGPRPDRPDPADRRDEELDRLATAIGVAPDDLRTALRALRRNTDRPAHRPHHRRPQPGGPTDRRARPHRRGDEATARPTEAERAKDREAFAAALAKRLKVDVERVTDALEARHDAADAERRRMRSALRAEREAFVDRLAKELDLPRRKVAEALAAERPDRPRRTAPRRHRSHAD